MSPRPDALARLAAHTAERAKAGLRRRLRAFDHMDGPWLERDGRTLLSFCGNDYLGLAQHPQLIAALKRTADDEGVGSGSAHLIAGHRAEHAALEEALAEWTGRERALLLDGAKLSGAELKRYPHADVEGAARQLQSRPGACALLATDGVFSMDGDVAPLRELSALCAREGATFMVDDAHGLGVLGPEGAGSVAAAELSQHDVPVLMATLGKALGCFGAFVAGRASLIEGLVQSARTFVYTTAMPPAMAAATLAAVRVAREDAWRRDKLQSLIRRFRDGAGQLGLPLMPSDTAIQPLLIGDANHAVMAAEALESVGFLVGAIRPPTVPQGKARLRITLSAMHEDDQVDALLEALSGLPWATEV